MSLVVSGVGYVKTELEQLEKLSKCFFGFKSGGEISSICLKFWHSDVNMNALQYIIKGKELFINGTLSMREYNGKTYVDINVLHFDFIDKKPKKQTSPSTKNSVPPPQAPEAPQSPPQPPEAPQNASSKNREDDIPF